MSYTREWKDFYQQIKYSVMGDKTPYYQESVMIGKYATQMNDNGLSLSKAVLLANMEFKTLY
jgi:hypothetical protein